MKRPTLIIRWRAMPVAMATLLVTLFVAAPVARAQGVYDDFSFDTQFIIGHHLWMLVHSDDPPVSPTEESKKRIASRIEQLTMLPVPSSVTAGGIVPKASTSYGALTPIEGAANPTCSHSDAVAIHPSGEYLYFGGGIGLPGMLCGYRIDPVTGAFIPVPGPPIATASLPSAIAIEPAGKFMYVAGPTSNDIWGYGIDSTTGRPSPIAGFPLATGGYGPGAIVIDRGGRFAYVANGTGIGGGAGSISVFALNRATGAWTSIAGSPFAMDPVFNDRAISLALTPDGRFLFVGGTVGVHTYSVDANSGALKLFAQRDSVFPGGVAVDPTGRFLYVPDSSAYLVRGFAIAANGALTPVGTQPFGAPNSASSRGIAILGDLVYVANTAARTVYGFRIQPTTGALSPVAGSPFATDARSFVLVGQGFLYGNVQVEAGDNFVAPLQVFGGQPPYAFSIASGALPPGLTLNEKTGVIAGIAAGNGAYTFTVLGSDAANASGTQTKTIFVVGAASTAIPVVEFYNAALDHYFIIYVADEIAKLDNGTFKGWARTGLSFKVWATTQSGTSAVCRIYIPPGKGDGHYFGRDANECDGTMAKNPTFVLESSAFFHLYPPTLGICAAGQVPVYRVYSNRADANHRYTTDRAVRDQMVGKGWLAEGVAQTPS